MYRRIWVTYSIYAYLIYKFSLHTLLSFKLFIVYYKYMFIMVFRGKHNIAIYLPKRKKALLKLNSTLPILPKNVSMGKILKFTCTPTYHSQIKTFHFSLKSETYYHDEKLDLFDYFPLAFPNHWNHRKGQGVCPL